MESYFGPDTPYAAIRELRIRLMDEYIAENGVEAKPGIYALLDALDDNGIPAAVTTSSSLERVNANLSRLNLLHRFARICQGSDVPTCKPEPEIYLYGAASLGLPPENCLALEDSPPESSPPIGRGACPLWFPTRTSRTKRPGKFSLPKPIPWLTLSASYNFCRTISSITVDNYESKCYCIFVDIPSLQKESVKENE